jgi:DNA topoisomerase-1
MAPKVVIVESPSKCSKIKGFLGAGYTVIATMGHIRCLEDTLDAVGIDREWEPRFQFMKEKSKAMKNILECCKGAEIIYLCADDDREGEAIAYSVACLLKKDPLSFPRSVFHEITQDAVRNAIAKPRKIDMNRVFAQQARSVLDMLVGFTISPVLWKHVAKKLSAGRCQTPALRLVCDRERLITDHTTNTSWLIKGEFKNKKVCFDATMDEELEDQESALNYLEIVYEIKEGKIESLKDKPWTLSAPSALMTSTLQQEASSLYKINPKATMKSAQLLYEAGHITYMRTDCSTMSLEACEEASKYIVGKYGNKYTSSFTQDIKVLKEAQEAQGSKEAQGPKEAHEAIRPTHFEMDDLPKVQGEEWSSNDRKIYSLIWKRAVQSIMSQAKGYTKTMKICIGESKDFLWSSSWRKTSFEGWQILGKPANLDDEEDKEEDNDVWNSIKHMKEGDVLSWNYMKAYPKLTKALPRFTEATLIRELEKKGIGRPSTFASLVEVLFEKEYIEKKDIVGSKAKSAEMTIEPGTWPPLTQVKEITLGAEKAKLVPTELGGKVVEFCVREFPQLFAYEFTSQMEERLDLVSKGFENWKKLCSDTWLSYKENYMLLNSAAAVISDKIKDLGDGYKAVMSKNGPLLLKELEGKAVKFYEFPKGSTITDITKEEALAWIEKLTADSSFGVYNGHKILIKSGPYGNYYECNNMKIPCNTDDTLESICAKLKEREELAPTSLTKGLYTFSVGQYGPYMYKTKSKGKGRIFVSIPSTIDVKSLSVEEADAIYKNGVEFKKSGRRKI